MLYVQQTIGVPSLLRSHTPPPTQKEVLTPKEVRISAVVEGASPPAARGDVSSSSEDKVRSPLVKKAQDGVENTKKISLSDDKVRYFELTYDSVDSTRGLIYLYYNIVDGSKTQARIYWSWHANQDCCQHQDCDSNHHSSFSKPDWCSYYHPAFAIWSLQTPNFA